VADPVVTADRAEPDAGRVRVPLLCYRILAYTVGVGLVVLVCVGMPLQFFAHNDSVVAVVGTAHGFLYMVYVVTVVVLAAVARWRLGRTVLIVLAGTIPFLSFVAERFVTRWVRQGR
jgi:integral membrane protein